MEYTVLIFLTVLMIGSVGIWIYTLREEVEEYRLLYKNRNLEVEQLNDIRKELSRTVTELRDELDRERTAYEVNKEKVLDLREEVERLERELQPTRELNDRRLQNLLNYDEMLERIEDAISIYYDRKPSSKPPH